MPEVKDIGKVWIRGKASPVFAVRVDDKIFVPGKEGEAVKTWRVEGESLCVDLCVGEVCVSRRFSLNLPSVVPATLFSGFENTKHGDVNVVLCQDSGVHDMK